MTDGTNLGLYGRRKKHLKGRLKQKPSKTYEQTRKETDDIIKRIMGNER